MTYNDFHSDLTLCFLSNLYLLNSPLAHSAPGTQTFQLNIQSTRYSTSFQPLFQLSARSPSIPIERMIYSIILFKSFFICHPLNASTIILLNIATPTFHNQHFQFSLPCLIFLIFLYSIVYLLTFSNIIINCIIYCFCFFAHQDMSSLKEGFIVCFCH